MKRTPYIGLLLALTISACQPQPQVDEERVAVIVALTQTAAALQNQPALPAEASATPQPSGDYQPLSAEECANLNNSISQAVGFPGEITSPVPFDDYVDQKAGDGCQIQYAVTGPNEMTTQARASLAALGWQEDDRYGAGGVGGMITAYRNSDQLCLAAFEVRAADENACPTGQGYILCMGNLPPEALRHTVTLNCAHAINP